MAGASPQKVRRVAGKVVGDRAVVHSSWRQHRLDVVLSHILGDAHSPKDLLAVVCAGPPHRMLELCLPDKV